MVEKAWVMLHRQLLAAVISISTFNAGNSAAQLVRESTKLGISTKTYIQAKAEMSPGVYRFKTKTVVSGCARTIDTQRCKLLLNDQRTGDSFTSDWRMANCLESTIDGNVITVVPRWGFDEGQSELLSTLCRQ